MFGWFQQIQASLLPSGDSRGEAIAILRADLADSRQEARVGAGIVQFVRRIHDADAPTALARGRAKEADRAPDIVNLDLGAQLAGLGVDAAFQGQQVAVSARDHPVHGGIVGRQRQ